MTAETLTWEWDVFLSFRGADTRYKFTDHLYHNLKKKHIRVFRDEERLRTGDEISPALVKAIEGSRISIVIFSKDYASCNSCLDELITILKCKKEKQQTVIPIFYEVDPSEVRYHRMDAHEQKYGTDSEKVQNWKSALEKASRLKGESYLSGSEYEFVEKICKKIKSFLGPPPLSVAKYPVGLGSRISEFESLMRSNCSDQNDVHMLGIYGISGIGKTTFAKAFYNSVAERYESACFVEVGVEASVGLVSIQRTILATVLGEEDINLKNIHEGTMQMQRRLRNKKILLILDDVNEREQLDALAGGCNWFGPGSTVIMTTKDKNLLRQHGITNGRTYELKQLDHHEAIELFCWHAFKERAPDPDFSVIADDLTKYARGVPLALEIIGADLCGKEKDEWEETLEEHKCIMKDDIFKRLKVSYDKLNDHAKDMFLDIAFFFNGESCDYLEKVFEGCKFYPKSGMGVLEGKCFIRRQDGKLWMHDLIQEMGKEIVRQESRADPCKRSRLWRQEDVKKVLNIRDSCQLQGTSAIQGLILALPEHNVVEWNDNCFREMSNLRVLIIRNARFSTPPKQLPNSLIVLHWEEYPSSSFPSDFAGNKLLDLRLGSAIHPIQLGCPLPKFTNVKYLHITRSEKVTQVPNLSCAESLIEIHLDFCCNLVEFDHGIGGILPRRLQVFSALGCSNLRACPEISSPVLKTVNLSGCRRLKSVPHVRSVALQAIYLQGCGENVARCFYRNEMLLRGLIKYNILQNNYPVVFVPGDTLPWFFQYVKTGNSLSFRVRRRVPTICIGFVLGPMNFDTKLSYEISLSLGDGLRIDRKGDFIQNSCRVFFCYLTNGLTEKQRILQDDWVDAEVNGILTVSGTTGRDETSISYLECGVFVDSIDSHFEDLEFCASRRECDSAMSYVNASSAVKIKTTIKEGMRFSEFNYVDGDSDDDLYDDGPPTKRRKKTQGRVDLPTMGWVKLRAADCGEKHWRFFAARDWTGRWLVGASSLVSRSREGILNIVQALKVVIISELKYELSDIMQQEMDLARKWLIQWGMEHRVQDITQMLGWKINQLMNQMEMEDKVRDIVEDVLQKRESMSRMEMEDKVWDNVNIMLWKGESMSPMEMEYNVRFMREIMLRKRVSMSRMKMEDEVRNNVEDILRERESMSWMEIKDKVKDIVMLPKRKSMSWMEMKEKVRDIVDIMFLERDSMSQMEMEVEVRDIVENMLLKRESMIRMEMEDEVRDNVEDISRERESMSRMDMEDEIRDMVMLRKRKIEKSQMEMEHRIRDIIQNLVGNVESVSQMEMDHRIRGRMKVPQILERAIESLRQITHNHKSYAELWGIKQGLEWALDRGLQSVIVESDSEETIHSLRHGVGTDHPCSSLVKKCRLLLSAAEEVRLQHVSLAPEQMRENFIQMPDQRGPLGLVLRDFCGVDG